MNSQVEDLFRQLADMAPSDRERYFREHPVADGTRREVEALLAFDAGASGFLERSIAAVAERALPEIERRRGRCGPYRLLEVVGRGGMGSVYRACREDGEVSQQVAIKLLPAWAGNLHRERFLQERQILASLAHPNIARMLDAGHLDDGQPFLVMEFVDGQPIDTFAVPLETREKIALFLKVCAAVAYLHRELVIHRDLKPSNILVTPSGEPKLLDFGIAKILDNTTDSTMTGMRMLTPDYASPEQVTGGRLTTATDVYSLGALLYRLLTGKPAHQFDTTSSESVARVITGREVTRPSKWAPELKGDLEAILLKALRKDSRERYASVDQFADDLLAVLEHRPVKARSAGAWYASRKFLRRHWLPMSAAAIVVASLSAGLYIANRERAIAQQRFQDVRQLAKRVLALDDTLRGVPGTTEARGEIVAMSQQYLERLAPQATGDPQLALEIAQAYFAVAGVQGLPTSANLGRYQHAEASLARADSILQSVTKQAPRNREALLLSAEIAQGRMILANTDHRGAESIAQARKAAAHLDSLFAMGTLTPDELDTAFQIFNNIALADKNQHLYDEAVRNARRAIALQAPNRSEAPIANAYSLIADSLRLSGDLDGALAAIGEARNRIERAALPRNSLNLRIIFNVLWREGLILGQQDNISLGREDEAAAVLQKAFDTAEEWARQDPGEAQSRILEGMAARELGLVLVDRDPGRAQSIYDRALARLREITGNTDVRRDEARLLAASSYALRRSGRSAEAGQRIEEAFTLLAQTSDYPAAGIKPDSEADAALRARADHLAATGRPQDAAAVYRELHDKIQATKPDPDHDLKDAVVTSRTDLALAELDRRIGRTADAATLDSRRLDMWRQWQQRLPGNPFIARQVTR